MPNDAVDQPLTSLVDRPLTIDDVSKKSFSDGKTFYTKVVDNHWIYLPVKLFRNRSIELVQIGVIVWFRSNKGICLLKVDPYIKTKNFVNESCREWVDLQTHQRNLDLETRAWYWARFPSWDLKSCVAKFDVYGGWKEVGLVGIERFRRDLQLSFRVRRQTTKSWGSNIRSKIFRSGNSGFRKGNEELRCCGLYIGV